MITLVGVGHVFNLRQQLRSVIATRRPAVVGVELDATRFALLKTRPHISRVHGLHDLLALFQRRIAHKFGVEVGDEMLAAAEIAQEIGAEIAFIDMDSRQVLSAALSQITFEEKVRLIVAALTGLFVRRKKVEEELTKYQRDESSYLGEFAKQFPSMKRILLDQRNEHMAAMLRDLESKHGRVVAVVGDGHVSGLNQLLVGRDVETLRLSDLLSQRRGGSNATIGFTVRPG